MIKQVCVCARCRHMSHMSIGDDIEKPQCGLCQAVLSVESMKPSNPERHHETKYPEHAKRIWVSSNGRNGASLMDASYETTFEIAKQKSFTQLDKHCLNE